MTDEVLIKEFSNDEEFRRYLLTITLEVIERIKKEAFKKRETKNPEIIRAKSNQIKLLLDSIKVCDNLIKNSQLDKFNKKLELFDKGIYTVENDSNELYELSDEAKRELCKIQDDFQVIID